MIPVWTKRHGTNDAKWKFLVNSLMDQMSTYYGNTKKNCEGIDFRRSSPFIQREVLGANMCLQIVNEANACLGFVLLKRKSCQNALYITLMSSFKKGTGTLLMHTIASDDRFDERFVIVRSTDNALPFYLKLGFNIFDWSSGEIYVSDGDVELTRQLQNAITDTNAMTAVRDLMIFKNYIPVDFYEWPLMIRRIGKGNTSTRKSSRISHREQMQTFRPTIGLSS